MRQLMWGNGQQDTTNFRLHSTSICPNRSWVAISFPVFSPLPLLVLLSLTRCNFVVSSVPAGRDNPLLLIILNQEGLCLSRHAVSLPLSAGDRQNGEEWNMCVTFSRAAARIGCPARKHFRKRKPLVRLIQKRRRGGKKMRGPESRLWWLLYIAAAARGEGLHR